MVNHMSNLGVRARSSDSPREVTECSREVVKETLKRLQDILKNQELFVLVEEYFEYRLLILDFCTALKEKCLMPAGDSQLHTLVLLQQSLRPSLGEEDGIGGNGYARTLKNFKAALDRLTREFRRQPELGILQSVSKQQEAWLDKLQTRNKKLDKKLKYIHAWRKVSRISFAATFAAVLICSVVAAATAAPPVAASLAAAASIPLGSMGKWIDSLLKNYENAVKGQKGVINLLLKNYENAVKGQEGVISSLRLVATEDLDNIHQLVVGIEPLMNDADFAIRERVVKVVIDEINKNLGVFMKNAKDLGTQADVCSRDIREASIAVLDGISKLHI